MSNKITIQRVAELANVSKATVSRVLNGYPHVRPAVRERVQRVIDETGYQPNNIARLLASDRSSIIGLAISSSAQMVFSDPYFPAITEAVSKSAASNDLVLSLFVSYSEQQGRDTLASILAAGLLDGLILTADYKGISVLPYLRQADIPFLFIGRPTNYGRHTLCRCGQCSGRLPGDLAFESNWVINGSRQLARIEMRPATTALPAIERRSTRGAWLGMSAWSHLAIIHRRAVMRECRR